MNGLSADRRLLAGAASIVVAPIVGIAASHAADMPLRPAASTCGDADVGRMVPRPQRRWSVGEQRLAIDQRPAGRDRNT